MLHTIAAPVSVSPPSPTGQGLPPRPALAPLSPKAEVWAAEGQQWVQGLCERALSGAGGEEARERLRRLVETVSFALRRLGADEDGQGCVAISVLVRSLMEPNGPRGAVDEHTRSTGDST